jgi:hypothetical protein
MRLAILVLTLGAWGLLPLLGGELTNNEPGPSAGRVSWWRGEGNARDSQGRADGVLYRHVTFAPGKVGKCFVFDGVSSGINVPDVPALAFTGSFSIECWLLVPRRPVAPGMVVFRGDTRSGLDPYYLSVEPVPGTSGLLNFVIWGDDNINESINTPMPIGSWTHVAATFDVNSCSGSSGVMTLYTNGIIAAQTNTTVRPLADLDPDYQPGVGIGNHSSQPGRFNYPLRGRIDELKLYDRALSASEVRAIYRAGSVASPESP